VPDKVFADCLTAIGVERRFSSHGLRRTANTSSGETSGRDGAGHLGPRDEKMTEHYSHIDPSEKRAVVQGMLSLVRGAPNPSGERQPGGRGVAQAEAGRDKTGTLTGTCLPKPAHWA